MLEMLMGGKPQPQIGTKMTYAQFQAWLTANPTKYTNALGDDQVRLYPDKYVSFAVTRTTIMYGTPYKEWFTYDSRLSTVARHAHPNLAVFTDNLNNHPQVLMKLTPLASRPAYISLDRNGFLSRSWTTYQGEQCLDFIYYDYTLESVVRYNPFLANDPVAFNGILV
ncbi:hypothetical protein REBECCA_284 [Erwinia phage Rebecca]|uniref:Uncharacterized protein n=1 Tax=Erwinia phage Rebecca TaxID=2530026 RepID=A0A482IJQ9_9CAUD|nr:hypothetical protein REBECCA_284 [Erwinia phage Rebecca]